MYRTILVPLDGSPRAETILPYVEELAHRFDSRVILLQVVELPSVITSPHIVVPASFSDVVLQQTDTANAYLSGIEWKFCQKGISAQKIATVGNVVDVILDTAECENADLVAMASHGRGGVPGLLW